MRSRTICSAVWQAAAVLGASVCRDGGGVLGARGGRRRVPDRSRVLNATHVYRRTR